MKRMNFPRRKAARRLKAEAMQLTASKLTVQQKLDKAKGAKERKRLTAKLNKK